jgi:general secretion pathway protein J
MTARGDAGLTLLELTAVMAIFSLVAVLSVQSLAGAMNSRERVAGTAGRTTELATTVTLLRRDLAAMVPVAQVQEGGEWTQAYVVRENELSFVVSGQPRLSDGARGELAQITWTLDPASGLLTRTRGAVPGETTVAEPAPMLEGVSDWSVRTLGSEGGWSAGNWDQPAQARALPRAVEVQLRVEEIGELRILVAR